MHNRDGEMSLHVKNAAPFHNTGRVSDGLERAVSANSLRHLCLGHPLIRSRSHSMGHREQSKDREAMDRRASLAAGVRKI